MTNGGSYTWIHSGCKNSPHFPKRKSMNTWKYVMRFEMTRLYCVDGNTISGWLTQFMNKIIASHPTFLSHRHKDTDTHTHSIKSNRIHCKKVQNYSTQYSRVVPHHSTDWAITSLTSEIRRDPVCSSVYGRNWKERIWWVQEWSSIPSL